MRATIAPSPASLKRLGRYSLSRSAICFLVLAYVGCNRQPFDYLPVSGRITYEDGTPLPVDGTLRLTFYSDAPPVDDKLHPRPGTAFPDENGEFSKAMTMRPGDGLVPGTHHVTVGYMGRTTKGIVPDDYTLKGQSPIVVDTAHQPFDIKIPRP